MWLLLLIVGLSTAGLAVLGVAAIRVFLAVRELARRVEAGTEALAGASERLRRAAAPMAERAGEISRS